MTGPLDWGRIAERTVLAGVSAVAALVSYTHLRDVWLHAGAPWDRLGPLLPDGLFASAWLQMRRRRRQGEPVGWLAWLALGVALLATLGGNISAAVIAGHRDLLSIVVAAIPAAVFALAWELTTGHGRRLPAQSPPGAAQPAREVPGLLDGLVDHLIGADYDETMRAWREHRSEAAGTAGGEQADAGGPVLWPPPDRAESNDVLAADLRAANTIRRAAGYDDLTRDQVIDRYGVGSTRAGKLRGLAAQPPAPPASSPVRPHLVRDGEEATA